MMPTLYHALILGNDALIKELDDGINALEWEYGVRIFPTDVTRLSALKEIILDAGYKLVSKEFWNYIISEMDDPKVISEDYYVSSRPIKDKWDADIEIY